MKDIAFEVELLGRALLRVPLHMVMVAFAMLLAISEDRTAACFAIAGAIMVLAWGWGTAAILIAVYGVLMFFQQALQAFLR